MLFLLHPSLEGVTEVDTDPKGRSVSFKGTTSNDISLFVPLQGIAPENCWLGGTFLKDYKIICKIKMREMKKKIMLGDFNCAIDKIDRDGEKKNTKTL